MPYLFAKLCSAALPQTFEGLAVPWGGAERGAWRRREGSVIRHQNLASGLEEEIDSTSKRAICKHF